MTLPQTLELKDIRIDGRIRSDLGDIAGLAASIQEFGVIEPLVVSHNSDATEFRLVAGGRRYAALTRLGRTILTHAREFIWREELIDGDATAKLRLQGIELEENLRREDLKWSEVVLGKQRLLRIMQELHGVATVGGQTTAEKHGVGDSGFGVRKLAAMLGESAGQTSKDLQLAKLVTDMPVLATADTKESALRKFNTAVMYTAMKQIAQAKPVSTTKRWALFRGSFATASLALEPNSVDLIYTDLPYGVDLSKMSKHDDSVVSYLDGRDAIINLLPEVASAAYRLLRNNRFAVFFFGFNYYDLLLVNLLKAGFNVNAVPVVWLKHTRSTENPNTRYANGYEQALVAMKGSPMFMRPSNVNIVDVPAIASSQRLQIAQQPVELVQRFVLDMTSPNGVVCDLCAGSGTTGEAAIRLGRQAVLFEAEPQACDIIEARLGAL